MGVHITIVRKEYHEEWGHYIDDANDVVFDSIRHFGDREFITRDWDGWNYETWGSNVLQRPKSSEQAKQWIIDNIEPRNQRRLLDAVDAVCADETLYFHAGF